MTPAQGKKLKPGAILQIDPAAGTDVSVLGRLCILAEAGEAWGAKVVTAPGAGVHNIAWSNLANTGGRAVWDPGGNPYPDQPTDEERPHHE